MVGGKALLFLDIDGVLNGDSRRFSERHQVHVSAEELRSSESPFSKNFTEEGLTFDVNLDPRMRAWMDQLSQVFELVWASTWEHLANTYISPLLGLGELGVVEHSKFPPTPDEVAKHDVALWKWRAIVPYAGGRPFCFVDDQAGLLRQRLRSGKLFDGPSVPLVLSPRHGLTGTDLAHLLDFGTTHLLGGGAR